MKKIVQANRNTQTETLRNIDKDRKCRASSGRDVTDKIKIKMKTA